MSKIKLSFIVPTLDNKEKLQPTLDLMDLLFMDIKHMDREKHRQFTGVDNDLILHNIAALGKQNKNIVVRIPTIMGVNGDEENIRNTARFVREHLPEPKLELLPYHSYGADKYTQLGLPYDEQAFRRPTDEELARLRAIVTEEGVEAVSYR